MSEEQLKAFLEAVKGSPVLQEKLSAADGADAVVRIAKEAGFVISAGELANLNQTRELSDEELVDLSGGGKVTIAGKNCGFGNTGKGLLSRC